MIKRIFKVIFIVLGLITLIPIIFISTQTSIPFLASFANNIIYEQSHNFFNKNNFKIKGIALGYSFKDNTPLVIIKGMQSSALEVPITTAKKVIISFHLLQSLQDKIIYLNNIEIHNVGIIFNSRIINSYFNKKTNKTITPKEQKIIQTALYSLIQESKNTFPNLQYLQNVNFYNIRLDINNENNNNYDSTHYIIDNLKINLVNYKVKAFSYLEHGKKKIFDLNLEANLKVDNTLFITADIINIQPELLKVAFKDTFNIQTPIENINGLNTNIKVELLYKEDIQNIALTMQTDKGTIKPKLLTRNIQIEKINSVINYNNGNLDISQFDINFTNNNTLTDTDFGMNFNLTKISNTTGVINDKETKIETQIEIGTFTGIVSAYITGDILNIYVKSPNLKIEHLHEYWPSNFLTDVKEHIDQFSAVEKIDKPSLHFIMGKNYQSGEFDLEYIKVDLWAYKSKLKYVSPSEVFVDKLHLVLLNNDLSIKVNKANIPNTLMIKDLDLQLKNLDSTQDNMEPISLNALIPYFKYSLDKNNYINGILRIKQKIPKDENFSYMAVSTGNLQYSGPQSKNIKLGTIFLNIELPQDDIIVNGNGKILGNTFNIAGILDNTSTALNVKFSYLSLESLKPLDFIPKNIFSGLDIKGGISIDFEEIKLQDSSQIKTAVNLKDAQLNLKILNYNKNKGENFFLRGNLISNNEGLFINNVTAKGKDFSLIIEKSKILNDLSLIDINLKELKIAQQTQLQAILNMTSSSIAVNSWGASLDISGILEFIKNTNFENDDASYTNYDIKVDIKDIYNISMNKADVSNTSISKDDTLPRGGLKNNTLVFLLNAKELKKLNLQTTLYPVYDTAKTASHIIVPSQIILKDNTINVSLYNVGYLLSAFNLFDELTKGDLIGNVAIHNKDGNIISNGILSLNNANVLSIDDINSSINFRGENKYFIINKLMILDNDLSGYIDLEKSYIDLKGKPQKILFGLSTFTPYIKGSFENIDYSLKGLDLLKTKR